jgi:flagellar biosynthesis anti-sigma factor FlgM
MDIRGISGLFGKMSEPPEKSEGKKSDISAQNSTQSDSVEISSEALSIGKLLELTEMAKSSPDIRSEKVAEMKAKIAAGEIPSPMTDKATAEALLNHLV